MWGFFLARILLGSEDRYPNFLWHTFVLRHIIFIIPDDSSKNNFKINLEYKKVFCIFVFLIN